MESKCCYCPDHCPACAPPTDCTEAAVAESTPFQYNTRQIHLLRICRCCTRRTISHTPQGSILGLVAKCPSSMNGRSCGLRRTFWCKKSQGSFPRHIDMCCTRRTMIHSWEHRTVGRSPRNLVRRCRLIDGLGRTATYRKRLQQPRQDCRPNLQSRNLGVRC